MKYNDYCKNCEKYGQECGFCQHKPSFRKTGINYTEQELGGNPDWQNNKTINND